MLPTSRIKKAIIIDHLAPCFSRNGPNLFPYLLVKNAIKKNLRPLVTIQMIIKKIKLKWINPLEIVKSLNGRGVNPAVKSIPSQEAKPPVVENFSFKKFGSS